MHRTFLRVLVLMMSARFGCNRSPFAGSAAEARTRTLSHRHIQRLSRQAARVPEVYSVLLRPLSYGRKHGSSWRKGEPEELLLLYCSRRIRAVDQGQHLGNP